MMRKQLIKSSVAIASVAVLLTGCQHDQASHMHETGAQSKVEAPVTPPVVKHEAKNIALNKTATASSTEYDDHSPAHAVDGSTEEGNRWCAADAEVPQWLKIDLGKNSTINSAEITWEFDGKQYLYAVEGSADGEKWVSLADRSTPSLQKSTAQVQKLDFPETPGIRYVRVRVTSLEEGAWASICELKVMGW